MLIIKEDTLIHTDSSSDVIEHFGVKGMKWGIRSRHKVLKDLYSSYKEADRHASNLSPAAINPRHPQYKLAMAAAHQAAADKAIYKSHMYAYLHKEKAQKARQKGKKIDKKVSDKLQKKVNDNYDMYSGHRKLVSSYYNSYTNQ